jgi:hypothetical protein
VPVGVCLERLSTRRYGRHLRNPCPPGTIAKNYDKLLPRYEASFGPVVRLDGTQSVDDVQAAIIDAIGWE